MIPEDFARLLKVAKHRITIRSSVQALLLPLSRSERLSVLLDLAAAESQGDAPAPSPSPAPSSDVPSHGFTPRELETGPLARERDEAWAFLRRAAMGGGSIVSSAAMTAQQIAIARAADRMLVMPDGYGFVYVPGPRFCACGRVESDCDQSRASCSNADPTSEDDESDIIIAGRQVPFVQVGMIVHPDNCPNCERDGDPLTWCSALVCDIHDDDETARFGMMATLLFRNGERREEPCDELRRHWRMARDFDQNRVYTGRWGAIPRGSVWPVAEVNEEA